MAKKKMKKAKDTSEEEEVNHLMDVFIETEETEHANCLRCGADFIDNYEDLNIGNKRIYCNECIKKMWSPTEELE